MNYVVLLQPNFEKKFNILKTKKMKKVVFALAIASMFGLVACNNNKPVEETVDTIVSETVEATCDSMQAVENAVEEVVEGAVEGAAEAIAE